MKIIIVSGPRMFLIVIMQSIKIQTTRREHKKENFGIALAADKLQEISIPKSPFEAKMTL